MLLELRHLRVVDAIAREGTVTRAAGALHLTQPAVSHALRELEQRLGVSLFRRDTRRMVATSEGERLLQSVLVVLDEIRRVERDLEQYRDGYRAVLRIATQCYTCYNWLPPLLKQFQTSHPKVSVEIVPDAKHDPIEALLEHRLDLAILFEEPHRKGLAVQRLFGDELVAIVPVGHPFGKRRYLTARDFADEHYVSATPVHDSTLRKEVLAPAGVEPRQWSVIPLTEAIIQTVVSGLGISVLPKWLVIPEVKAGRLQTVRVTRGGLKRVWYAAARTEHMARPAVGDLVRRLASDGYGVACECRSSA